MKTFKYTVLYPNDVIRIFTITESSWHKAFDTAMDAVLLGSPDGMLLSIEIIP